MQIRQLKRASKEELGEKLALFIFCPFLSFLYSLRDAASRSSYVIYFLFGVAICWSMDVNFSPDAHYDDLQGIMERFRNFHMSGEDLRYQISEYFSFSGHAEKELYGIAMMWFTKLFTQNPHAYFALSAVVYLIFFLNCLKRITRAPHFDNSFYCLIILLLFVVPRDIITVQNPRYSTAMWMAIMGTFNYYLATKHRMWNVLWIAAAPLCHSGMWAYAVIFIAGQMLIKLLNHKVIWAFYIISIPFVFFSYDVISMVDIQSLPLPSNFQRWVSWYFNEDSFNKEIKGTGASGFAWVGQTFAILSKIMYVGIPFILKKYSAEISGNKLLWQFLWFFIFYAAVVNFMQAIPVLGYRSYFVTRILSMYFWIIMVYPRNNKYLLYLLAANSWEIFYRYFYKGAVNSSVPKIFFIEPLPVVIYNYWGAV